MMNGRWIPCKVELPKESGLYQVQLKWGGITTAFFSKKYQDWDAGEYRYSRHAMEVVAWKKHED